MASAINQKALRDPNKVMRLDRLGSFHQSRLSFMRVLLRRLKRENWTFDRPVFDIDANGVGRAVYSAHGPNHSYSLIAFAHDLPAEKRSDRVIAEAWDSTFTLFDGVPTKADVDRLATQVPLQEAGRISEAELSLSRANRSVRLWKYVVEELANGLQPDTAELEKVGYLMRTTAVYGSGKFGAADRSKISGRPEFAAPFQAELLSVYLIRTFVRDLIEHMAKAQGGTNAVSMDANIARTLGIGNSTGLGMAPFILNHPVLFNNWISARETAIARVRAIPKATATEVKLFRSLLNATGKIIENWRSQHPLQIEKVAQIQICHARLSAHVDLFDDWDNEPWDKLMDWAKDALGLEGQECLASLILEPYGDQIDALSDDMSSNVPTVPPIDGTQTIGQTLALIDQHFGWATNIDWTSRAAQARAWYVSEEKLEPRLGERFDEDIAQYEQPLCPARDAHELKMALLSAPKDQLLADFLNLNPTHRHIARRIQLLDDAPYAEIRDNTISDTLLPIDMLRCKLSFFGAIHFDPRSDRWVRICMYSNAPYPNELAGSDADLWVYPDISGTLH